LRSLGLKLRALLLRDSDACHQLGAMLATGDGLPKDEAAAVRWYRRGAELGDPFSQFDLAYMILLGEGTPSDPIAAVSWLERAAAAGDLQAPSLLSDLCASGLHGVNRDEEKARRWAEAAARARDRWAEEVESE